MNVERVSTFGIRVFIYIPYSPRYEWQNRIKIFKELAKKDPSVVHEVIVAYTEAVKTVVPQKATGSPHVLWVDFARYYEDNGGCVLVLALVLVGG